MIMIFETMGLLEGILPDRSKFSRTFRGSAVTTILSSLLGTSPTVAAAESAAGIASGGRTGLMGACARGVKHGGGCVTGIIPEKLNRPGIAFEGCDELIVTADMHERKATMERLSDAYIVLPGGMPGAQRLVSIGYRRAEQRIVASRESLTRDYAALLRPLLG